MSADIPTRTRALCPPLVPYISQAEDPDPTKLSPLTRLIGVTESAHGVSDVNCVCWAPASLAPPADPNAPASIIELDADGNAPNGNALGPAGDPGMCDFLASAGDDGTVKVWTVPSVSA